MSSKRTRIRPYLPNLYITSTMAEAQKRPAPNDEEDGEIKSPIRESFDFKREKIQTKNKNDKAAEQKDLTDNPEVTFGPPKRAGTSSKKPKQGTEEVTLDAVQRSVQNTLDLIRRCRQSTELIKEKDEKIKHLELKLKLVTTQKDELAKKAERMKKIEALINGST